jgi:hypothetical protein
MAGGLTQLSAHREVSSMVIALDHSSSMSNSHLGNSSGSRLSLVQDEISDLLNKYGPIIRFGYVEFPGIAQGKSCSNSGCCVGKVSQPVPGSEVGIMAALNQCGMGQSSGSGCLNSDATPTAQALGAINDTYASLAMGMANVSPQRFALLITDGEPGCAMGMGASADPCMDAVTEGGRLNVSGVPTYVVGIGDIQGVTDPTVGGNVCLNDLASNTGRAQRSPNYYAATNENLMRADLAMIVTESACHIETDDASAEPDKIQIDFAGVPIARDPNRQNGWQFEGVSITQIAFYGDACQAFLNSVLASGMQKIHVNGCPSAGTH